MEALANLGIDWKLFLAQAVNFLILLFILRRYAYRPMLEFLEKRSDRIEKGLKDARHEAKALIEAAEISAKKRDAERLAETELKTKRFLEEARTKIEDEKKKSIAEVKQEIAEVVTVAVEKVLREKMDTTKYREL